MAQRADEIDSRPQLGQVRGGRLGDADRRDAAGKMVVFPYPLEHVTGDLQIREGYVDILSATMKKAP